MKTTRKKLWLSSLVLAASVVGLASCIDGGDLLEGEWYGVGIEVDKNARTEFMVGEKVHPESFNFTAYDDGEEVTVDPADVTVEPSRSLTTEDKQLKFKWKKYSTTLDINVGNSLTSECELMEKAPVKYTEPEHIWNKKGNEPDPTSEDASVNVVDTTAAKVESRLNADGTTTGYLSNVSYGSSFSYSIDTDNEGDEIYLYGSTASNIYKWGKVPGKYTTATLSGSGAIDLSKVINITNNGTKFDSKVNANIPAITVTEEDMDAVLEAIPAYNKNDKPFWNTTTYLSTRNFQRRWLGKVTLVKGMNDIKIDFNGDKIKGAGFAYAGLACGNWDNIELRYVKKGETLNNAELKVTSYPKTKYIIGEKFSLENAAFYLEDATGLTDDVIISEIQISNTDPLTPSDKSIELNYKGAKLTLPIDVTSKIVSDFHSDTSPIKYIEPVHDRNKSGVVVGAESADVDTRAAKQSRSLDGTAFLENVSAFGKFQYVYESGKAHGKFDIYASVASNGSMGGDVSTVWPGAKTGFTSSIPIDFTKCLTLKNNDTEYEINEGAKIEKTTLTADMDPNAFKGQDVTKSAWSVCTYYLSNNFKRIHIGTVDIVKGTNNIVIDLNYNESQRGGFGYCGSLCGNWKDIEIIYIDESTNQTVSSIEMKTSPTKSTYAPGEYFAIDGAEFYAYNAEGVELGKVDNSEIEIIDDHRLYPSDNRVQMRYKGFDFYVDVNVTGVVKQTLNTITDMTIAYHESNEGTTGYKASVFGNSYLQNASAGSYFEYTVETSKEMTVSISAEIATNAYLRKTGDYKDYDTGFPYWAQSWVGSYDLDVSKTVKLSNTVGGETKNFDTNEGLVAKGHMVSATNPEDAALVEKKGTKSNDDGTIVSYNDEWGITRTLCLEKFANFELGDVTLSPGTNVIRITLEGQEDNKHAEFGYNQYACGNWKSISISFK